MLHERKETSERKMKEKKIKEQKKEKQKEQATNETKIWKGMSAADARIVI